MRFSEQQARRHIEKMIQYEFNDLPEDAPRPAPDDVLREMAFTLYDYTPYSEVKVSFDSLARMAVVQTVNMALIERAQRQGRRPEWLLKFP
jgi:hypothetical protein